MRVKTISAPYFLLSKPILHIQSTLSSFILVFLHLLLCWKRLSLFYFKLCKWNWHDYVWKPYWSAFLNTVYTIIITTVLDQTSVTSLCLYSDCKLIIKLQPLQNFKLDSIMRKKSSCQNLPLFDFLLYIHFVGLSIISMWLW